MKRLATRLNDKHRRDISGEEVSGDLCVSLLPPIARDGFASLPARLNEMDVPDVVATTRPHVRCSPEEHAFAPPRQWNEADVLEEVLQQAGVHGVLPPAKRLLDLTRGNGLARHLFVVLVEPQHRGEDLQLSRVPVVVVDAGET